MEMMTRISSIYTFILLFFLGVAFLTSCGGKSPERLAFEADSLAWTQLIVEWNDAMQGHHWDKLEELYAPKVRFYQSDKTNQQVIEYILMKSMRTFEQPTSRVMEGIGITGKKVEFLLEVSQSNRTRKAFMYFELEKQNGKWRITAESDEPTDDFYAREKYSPVFGQ
jgi:hypothetical protein